MRNALSAFPESAAVPENRSLQITVNVEEGKTLRTPTCFVALVMLAGLTFQVLTHQAVMAEEKDHRVVSSREAGSDRDGMPDCPGDDNFNGVRNGGDFGLFLGSRGDC